MNPSRYHLARFVERAARSVPPDELVLDAGAGGGDYRALFSHARYESADFAQLNKHYGDLTYVCDLAAIPVADARYRLVLLTQVLEHLPDPLAVLRELRRVLAPGGQIWASSPLFYEEHEQPYDFFRYTRFGLRHVFEQAGFTLIELEWLEGYGGTISYELDVAARALGRRRWLPARLVLRGASRVAAEADVRRKRTDIGHPKNYTVVGAF